MTIASPLAAAPAPAQPQTQTQNAAGDMFGSMVATRGRGAGGRKTRRAAWATIGGSRAGSGGFLGGSRAGSGDRLGGSAPAPAARQMLSDDLFGGGAWRSLAERETGFCGAPRRDPAGTAPRRRRRRRRLSSASSAPVVAWAARWAAWEPEKPEGWVSSGSCWRMSLRRRPVDPLGDLGASIGGQRRRNGFQAQGAGRARGVGGRRHDGRHGRRVRRDREYMQGMMGGMQGMMPGAQMSQMGGSRSSPA